MNKKHKILCVDDNKKVLSVLQEMLNILDYDVKLAFSASEALSALETDGPFFMIISDHQMPGMNGAELLSHIRIKYPEVTRVLTSGGLSNDETEKLLLKNVCHHFLNKPWNFLNLSNVLLQTDQKNT